MKFRVTGFLKAVSILFGAILIPFSGEAQSLIPFELNWRQGTLVLTNGDTLQGHASLSLPNDIVRLSRPDGTMTTFTPNQIQSLKVQEPFGKAGDVLKDQREYRQYTWNRDNDFGNYLGPALFIVAVSGKYGLLVREERLKQGPGGGGTLGWHVANHVAGTLAEQIIVEKIYLRMPNQKVKLLRNRKSDLLEAFPDKKKTILKFARDNNLEFNNIEELARIVSYCNTI